MARSRTEEKVNQLAATQVDTYISRNQNKIVTGKQVRPVIENWADKLSDIISSSKDDETPPEDVSRLHKALNSLENLLENKDDELTYIIVNAPKKFWGTLRYIFDDTFGHKPYNPEPLTKYELPRGHLDSVIGYGPQKPKAKQPVIPEADEPSQIRINYNGSPRRKPNNGGAAAQIQKEEERKKKEQEEKEKAEQEEKERQEQEAADNQREESYEVPQNIFQNYLHAKPKQQEEVLVHNREEEKELEAGPDIGAYKKLFQKIADTALLMTANYDQDIQAVSYPTMITILEFLEKELEKIPEAVAKIDTKVGEKETTSDYKTRVKNDFAEHVLPILLDIGRVSIDKIVPNDNDFMRDNGKEINQYAESIKRQFKYLSKADDIDAVYYKQDVYSLYGIAEVALDMHEDVVALIKLYKSMKKSYLEKVALLKEIFSEHKEAASTGKIADIKNRLSPDYYPGSRRDPKSMMNTSYISSSINVYLTNRVATKSFKRLMLLINASKRLKSYVQ